MSANHSFFFTVSLFRKKNIQKHTYTYKKQNKTVRSTNHILENVEFRDITDKKRRNKKFLHSRR